MYLSSQLYFGKQSFMSTQCGKYAVNNLLGKQQVTCKMLDDICVKLNKQIKQNYRHSLGGDYDVNVLIDILGVFNKDCKWLGGDKIKIYKESQQHRHNRSGYLINRSMKPNLFKYMVGLSDRHWIAVRFCNGQYYLLDSKSESNVPEHIMSIAKFLQVQLEKGSHIIEVTEKQ